SALSGLTGQPKASAETYSTSLAGAVRWTLSSRIFTSMVSVGAPGMANSTTSLRLSGSAYATVLGATLIRSAIWHPLIRDFLSCRTVGIVHEAAVSWTVEARSRAHDTRAVHTRTTALHCLELQTGCGEDLRSPVTRTGGDAGGESRRVGD